MPTYDWLLFDTQIFAANTIETKDYFQTKQGGTSAATKNKTNGRGNGSLPDKESYLIKNLSVVPLEELNEYSSMMWFQEGYVEIHYKDRLIFSAPLLACVGLSSFSGVNNQAVASDSTAYGINNNGFVFNKPILIEGGNSFRVSVSHLDNVSEAVNIGVYLNGELELE